jgi:beta-glucosidase
LSYTTFAYRNLRIDKPVITANDELIVSVTVSNTGQREGKEVVQVYVGDLVASISPPGRRLRRFAKVDLAQGQSRTLTFKLRRDDLSFIGADNKSVLEPGEFEVKVGGLTQRFTLR